MAKAKTSAAPKKKKSAAPKGVTIKVKGAKGKSGTGKKSKKANSKGFETLTKLADHPLIGELLAVGAMAAVAAIAEKSAGKAKTGGSTQAVKAAGKAAAAAIGARLLSEIGEIKKSAKPSGAK